MWSSDHDLDRDLSMAEPCLFLPYFTYQALPETLQVLVLLKDIKVSEKTSIFIYRNICLPCANCNINFDIKEHFCWYFTKISFLMLDLVFLPLKYPQTPSSLQQNGSKKDLWVILDICSKDQILSGFSKFDLDLDQDHQIWSRSWSFRSLDQIFQCTGGLWG